VAGSGLTAAGAKLGLADSPVVAIDPVSAALSSPPEEIPRAHAVGGLLVYDSSRSNLRILLYLFVFLVIWLSRLTGIPDREGSADFYSCSSARTLGMGAECPCRHLLKFIAIEMASLRATPLAASSRAGGSPSEAALKYVVYGGGRPAPCSTAISLLAGNSHRTTVAGSPPMGLVRRFILEAAWWRVRPGRRPRHAVPSIGYRLSSYRRCRVLFWYPSLRGGERRDRRLFVWVASKRRRCALARLDDVLRRPRPVNAVEAAS